MPKFGIHYIIMKKLQEKLKADGSTGNQALGRILAQNPFAASIGSIGPDLMFWTPDYAVTQNLLPLVTTYDAIMRNYVALEETVQTIQKNINAGVKQVVDELEQVPIIGDAIRNVEDVINDIGAIVAEIDEYAQKIAAIKEQFSVLADSVGEEMVLAFFIQVLGLDSGDGSENKTLARSLFHGLFQSCCQGGREEMDWYWFEMLHYRRTGDFAKALIRNAEASGDEEQMAYAYAWMTHIAADLVGHPFVNTISGSPFRMNVQRHVVIENFMDQWKWIDEFEESNIRNSLLSELGFEDILELPDTIAALISDTMKEVYGAEDEEQVHPLRYVTYPLAETVGVNPLRDGFLSPADIKIAYSFLHKMVKFMGGQKDRPQPKEPFPGADTHLADLMSSSTVPIPLPPPFPHTDLPQNVDEFFETFDEWMQALAAYIDWGFAAAGAMMDAASDALTAYLANPIDESLKLIQALAYGLARKLYDIYRNVHQPLALAGLAYPEPDDVALTNPAAEALITPRHVKYKHFPILRTPGQPHLDTESYLSVMKHSDHSAFKSHHVEQPETVASYHQSEADTTPDVFIDGVPLDIKLLSAYARAQKPEDTRRLQKRHKKHFGNAVDLTKFILENRDNDKLQDVVFCNWNLDADRGYGYKSWDGVPFTVISGEIDGAINGNEPLDEVVAQNFSVWTKVTEDASQPHGSRYESEIYVGRKTFAQTLLSSLNISEHYIPTMFRRPESMAAIPIGRWIQMVPRRFRITTQTSYNNFFFCNGLETTPSSGVRSTIALQKILNLAVNTPDQKFNIKLIHNYTSPDFGDLHAIGDLWEAVPHDYLSTILNERAISDGIPFPEVTNPTQVAIIALLHYGMDQHIPLILSGHSQGCMITANAIMVFSSLGQPHRDYLTNKVKFFQMEPELLIGTRALLRTLLKQSLVYIMNDSDPPGTDLLLEAGAGRLPGMPWQPTQLLLDGEGMQKLRDAFADPDLLNVEFYRGLEGIVSGFSGDITDIMGYFSHLNAENLLQAHFMPAQVEVIEKDIKKKRFRTDPGTLDDPTVQLSTTDSLNGTSVNVRDFFIST